MTRLTATIIGLALAGLTLAQGTFTIRQPVEGQTVRETVAIRIPRNSVPDGGYVGILVNGKFIEAALPLVEGRDYVYRLDTKARGIADGRLKLEAVLYVDYNEKPRVVNRSSVNVRLDNRTSIQVPATGLRLRYKFAPGVERFYQVDNRVSFSTISDRQNRAGGRAAELPLDAEQFRYVYAVENTKRSGAGIEGLIRMQPLPKAGRDEIYVTTADDPQPRRFDSRSLASIYMQVTDTGREIFGGPGLYVPMQGSSGTIGGYDLYAIIPLPVLPSKPVKVGESWQAPFLADNFTPATAYTNDRLTLPYPARGTFEGLEYEGGRRTAKIRNTIALGTTSTEGRLLQQQGRAFSDDKIELNELIWFDIDRGVITKLERNVTIDRKVENASGIAGSGGNAPRAGGPPRGGFDDENMGGGGPARGGGGPGPAKGGFWQKAGMPGLGGGQPGGNDQGNQGGPQRGFGGRQGRGQNNTAGQPQFVRIRLQLILTLER